MTKFHNTADGPRVCIATERQCKYEHFASYREAQTHFESSNNHLMFPPLTKSSPGVSVSTRIERMKYNSYLGAEIGRDAMKPALRKWVDVVGQKRADALQVAKHARDGEHVYHVTVMTPQEFKPYRKNSDLVVPDNTDFTMRGVGKITDGNREAWFVVCSSPSTDQWRASLSLPPKDYHITLGFDEKDIFTAPKNESTIVNPL